MKNRECLCGPFTMSIYQRVMVGQMYNNDMVLNTYTHGYLSFVDFDPFDHNFGSAVKV